VPAVEGIHDRVDRCHSHAKRQLLFVLGPRACLLFASNAIMFASVAVYAVALCVQLSVAVLSFYAVVAAASS
jgi:hypothetical protein